MTKSNTTPWFPFGELIFRARSIPMGSSRWFSTWPISSLSMANYSVRGYLKLILRHMPLSCTLLPFADSFFRWWWPPFICRVIIWRCFHLATQACAPFLVSFRSKKIICFVAFNPSLVGEANPNKNMNNYQRPHCDIIVNDGQDCGKYPQLLALAGGIINYQERITYVCLFVFFHHILVVKIFELPGPCRSAVAALATMVFTMTSLQVGTMEKSSG